MRSETGHLSRKFTAKNFQAALDFVVAAGAVAERVGHHPDLHITSYKNVEVPLTLTSFCFVDVSFR